MNAKDFGERISMLRKKQGLTQLQLAEKLNVSNKTISRWETGEGYPDISVLSALANHLHVTVDQLLAVHNPRLVVDVAQIGLHA